MPDIVQAIKGTYSLHEGFGAVQAQKADPQNANQIYPAVNAGYTIEEFNTLYGDRLNRPRYYTSTPSGLPY
jgi:hypothetical protein